jgi:bifunctional oligoribonuclease and PAP phosphatase NrnA
MADPSASAPTTAARPPSPESYLGTIGPAEAGQALRSARRAVVITHAKPDGDAAGSALAATRTLLALGCQAEAWLAGPYPAWLGELAADTPVRKIGAPPPLSDVQDADLAVVVDTGSWNQLDLLKDWVAARGPQRTLVADHHRHGNPEMATRRLIDNQAASATQVLAPALCQAMGRTLHSLPLAIAEPLYLGLATDTGWFKFSSVSADVFEMAAALVRAGVRPERLYELIEQRDSPARPLLLGRALAGMTYHRDGAIAAMAIRKADFTATGAELEQSGGFSELALAVAAVKVVAIFTEVTAPDAADPLTKVSLRSKPGPAAVDVAAVAATLGGGGHVRAAGVKVKLRLADAQHAVLSAMDAFPSSASVGGAR